MDPILDGAILKPMTEPIALSEREIKEQVGRLDGWEIRDGRLRKQFTFRTFLRAIAFVNSLAYVAEGAGHHPDLTINYNKVTVRIITHAVDALTERDFSLARLIDERLSSTLIIQADS